MTVQAPPPTQHELLRSASDIIRTVDEKARDINRRWGHNRLPHLVPIEWMEKFRAQKGKWELACFECVGSPNPIDIDRVRQHGNAMLRAFDKLEQEANALGNYPEPVSWWEFETRDGKTVILVRDRHEMGQVDPKGRSVQIWSLEEVADVIQKFPALALAKDCFPGAEVIPCRTNPVILDELNDSLEGLPF